MMLKKLNLILAGTLLAAGFTQTSAQETNGNEVLGRFVGIWELNGEARPSKWYSRWLSNLGTRECYLGAQQTSHSDSSGGQGR